MRIPLFDTRSTYTPLRAEVERSIQRVVDGGDFVMGKEVESFEEEFADYLGVRHVVGVANGTDALTIALRALDIGPGHEVVVPSFTFYATAEAVPHTGAQPVFCDIDPRTFCITAETLDAVITPRTRAVICVHLFGNSAPMHEICSLAAERGLVVIEDTAQAAGARLGGLKLGTFGEVATFSFYPSKNLFCFGDGGAVATNDDWVAKAVRRLRAHGSRDKNIFEVIGYNSRLDAIQAAVLRLFLPRLDDWNAQRRRAAERYEKAGLGEFVELPTVTDLAEHVYHLFVTRSPNRGKLIEQLGEAGVQARAYYSRPLHRQPALERFVPEHGDALLKGTMEAARTNLALPMSPALSREQIDRVVSTVANLGRSD